MTRELLDEIAERRILILDGAMGTMIQQFRLTEADFRGPRFAEHPAALAGCNDVLCLTCPWVISGIHEAYLRAGADIIETCSFNATAVSLADYGIGHLAYEISAAAGRLARKAADKFSTPEKPRFVAGSMGPTAKSASLSPDPEDPARRSVHWGELEAAYYDNARGLLDGGADILLIETVFDTLNAKAAIAAVIRLREERRQNGMAAPPLMISATIAGGGRLLSAQTVEAFCVSVLHADPWALGLNCSFGAEGLKPHVAELAAFAPCLVSAHPNAGMPNQLGEYGENPVSMAALTEAYMKEGLVNILGGCCGSTPAHIAVIAARAGAYKPRRAVKKTGTFLSGLEPLRIGRDGGGAFTVIGERANVAGSRKFLRMIQNKDYDGAVDIARTMAEQGAAVIDVCMDDALLDAEPAMKSFISLALCYPDIARLPLMIDSSRWEVIESALAYIQGKSLVNSISLKEGEAEFLRRAGAARRFGAAVVVMLFDEQGQAAEYERKIEVARRSWKLLVESGFPPEDIVFDPNVLAAATGMSEHDRYALDFIRACAWIRENCPGAQISGGVSNLSFSFRGNDTVRDAMHAVFLKHAVEAGLTMAIVNPASLSSYDDIEAELREAAEDVILCRSGGTAASGETAASAAASAAASDRLLALALAIAGRKTQSATAAAGAGGGDPADWRGLPAGDRVVQAMIRGIDDYIEADIPELTRLYPRSLDIVEGPLMEGMREVGNRFGEGKLFLPQVIRAARVMKRAVALLAPLIEAEKSRETGPAEPAGSAEAESAGRRPAKIVLATVKGDVHDIGKNIVSVVLGCNGYDILDLGVMVPAERIIEAAEREGAALVGLSGLITPSLDEMIHTAREMEKRGLTIPLIIGGAAANLAHTGLRIAPEYSGPVIYVRDAGQCPETVRRLLSASLRPRFLEETETRYREAAERHASLKARLELIPLEEARNNKAPGEFKLAPEGEYPVLTVNDYPLSSLIPHIDWKDFLRAWELDRAGEGGREDAKNKLLEDGRRLLDRVASERIIQLRGVVGFFPALSRQDDILLFDPADPDREIARFSFLRNQEKKRAGGPNPCLADFIAPEDKAGGRRDRLGLFALSAGFGVQDLAAEYRARQDDYNALLLDSLANSLAGAFAEETAVKYAGPGGIRPAFGYPACPDHQDKRLAFKLLQARERCGLELTESAMIIPPASVCGMLISNPRAYYFGAGDIGKDQLRDWAARKGITPEEARKRTGRI